jgi:hypothetical protein
MAIIKNTNKKCSRGFEELQILIHCWWECKWVQTVWNTVWTLLKTLKLELLYDPAKPCLGVQLKGWESGYNKGTCTHMFFCTIIHNS